MSFRRRALFLAGLFVAVSCSDAGNLVGPPVDPIPGPGANEGMALDCSLKVATGDLECVDAQPGTGSASADVITVGGQNQKVRLVAFNHTETGAPANGAKDTLTISVTVQNLMAQALGTTDGTTVDPAGVRLLFSTEPIGQPTGDADVVNAGIAMITGGDQRYFQYGEILSPGEVSAPQNWTFVSDESVTNIHFRILVQAAVPFPGGFIKVTPAFDTLATNETVDLEAIVYNAVSDTLPVTPTWSSSDTNVATVDVNTGLVTAVGFGTAIITATHGAKTGTATIVVNNAPVVLQDTTAALSNVTIPHPAGRLLAKATDADGAGGGALSVVADSINTAQNGVVITQADGSFTYLSAPGASGEDSFQFMVTDGARVTTGTMVVNVAASNYWYVRANAADGDGRDRHPFGTVGAAVAAASAAGSGGTILVIDNGSLTLAGPVTLGAGQSLIGQGIPTSIVQTVNGQPVTILSAGTQPELTSATGSTVTLGTDNVIKGLAISSTAGATGISGSAFSTLRLWYSTVQATTGAALVLSGGALDADSAVTVSSANSPTNGISLTNVTGSLTTTGGAISGSEGTAFVVSGNSVSVSYGGSVTQGSSAPLLAVSGSHTGTLAFPGALSATAGTGLQFNAAAGTYNFTGTATLAGGDAGVDITNGSSGTFVFGTGTAITSPTGTAFVVYGSSPTVTYSGNITQANNAPLVDVSEQPGGTVTFQTGTLSATNGTGILFSNADGTVAFNGTTTLNGGDAGVDVVAGSDGTFAFAAGTSITNPTGTALNAASSAPASLTYAGTISANAGRPVAISGGCGNVTVSGAIAGTGLGVLVQNCASGSVAFTGAKTLNTGANQAVTLTNNGPALVSFAGGSLAVTTTSGAGFTASSGGVVHVTGSNNTISTGTGTGLSLNGVSTGTSGVVFRSVSTGAATNGIALNNLTGMGVTVTGDGSTVGSGGTISGTSGHGVSLTNLAALTTGVSLNYLNVTAGAGGNAALFGSAFGSTSASGVSLSATGGPALNLSNGTFSGALTTVSSSGSASTGVSLTNVAGSVTTTGGTIAGGAAASAFVVSGGSVSGTVASAISQANATRAAVEILGGHNTGTLTFSGTVSATNGTGLQFTDADATYNLTGSLSLAGGDAGIDIGSGSAGTVNVNPSGSAVITSPSGPAISIVGGSADLTYRGNVTQANAVALLSVTGGHSGDVAFPSGTINASNGTGLQFDNADGTYDFGGGTVTLNGGDAGIDVTNGSGGTFSFPASASITSPSTGNLVSILNSAPSFTYTGTFTKANNNVTGILVSNNTGGTVTFNGAGTKTISSGSAAAVNLSTNTGTTINFGGGSLALTSGSGAGFTATGGGTVNVTGGGNTVSSTGGGTAVNVQNTTIGASGMSFQSVNASGGANGIVLVSTGNTNGLQVTGTGTNGSGGSIVNTTGGDGAMAGNGVYLSSARSVSLSWMALSGHANNGIYGTGVRGLTLNKVRVTGTNGNNNSGTYDESAVNLVNLGGAVKVTNSRFDGGAYNAFRVENISGTAPVLDSLVIENDTIESMQGSTADVRGTALLVSLQDGTADTRIRSNRVTAWWGNAIHVLVQGTASGTSRISNNFVDNTNGALAGAGGIAVAGGNHTYNISGNTVRHTNGAAISADRVNFGTLMQGTIEGNTIGVAGDNNSGSAAGAGIFASHHGPGTTTHAIRNNTIRQVTGQAAAAIWVLTGDASGFGGSGTLNATVTGNDLQQTGSPSLAAHMAILATVGSSSGPPNDTDQACLDIGGNTAALRNNVTNFNTGFGFAATAENRMRVNQRFGTTSRFPGYTGAQLGVTSQTDLASYLLGRNTASNSTNANTSTGGFNNTSPAGSACPQPSI